jgi:hypothetical protein
MTSGCDWLDRFCYYCETVIDEVGKSLLSALLLISMGGDPTPTEELPPEAVSELADCYKNAAPHPEEKG